MSSVIVTVHIEAKTQKVRDELLQVINNIVESARTEDGVLRYIVGLPIDETNQTSIYLIEEYATEAIRLDHLASDPVKVLLSHLESNSSSIANPPEIHVFNPSISYSRHGLTDFSQSSLLILAFFGYQPNCTSHALEGWKAIVDNCEANEPPVLAYAVLEDVAGNMIRTVEIYSDAEFASTAHLKSDAVKFNQGQNGADRDGKKGVVKLKPVAGFLGHK